MNGIAVRQKTESAFVPSGIRTFANFTDEPVTGIGVAIDGEKIDLEEPVILIEGTIYIPAAAIYDQLSKSSLHNVKKSKDKINNYNQSNQIYNVTHNHYRLHNLIIL